MEESRSRWLRTCKRQMQTYAEYKMFWGLRLYTEYICQNNTLAQEKTCLCFKMGSIINNYKNGYFALALDFPFTKPLTVQILFYFFKLQRDFQTHCGSFAEQHQEQELPWPVATHGSLMGCIPVGTSSQP